MKRPMVSVLINNHNYGEYVGEAIQSVLNQTYESYEIIIVDGGSTDRSRDVIMSYLERYPEKLTAVFKPGSGQAAAINTGFQLSRGDIIALLDADDFFYENKLERVVEAHRTHAFVGHARRMLNYRGELSDITAPLDETENRTALLRQFGYIYTYFLITSCISAKRELFSKILPMPEKDYETYADCYIKVMAQYYDNISYLDEPLSFYRVHSRQRSGEFVTPKTLIGFIDQLFERTFNNINKQLCERGEPPIPPLNAENFRQAFALANPEADIREGESYVIYGTGNNSWKMRDCLKRLGARCIYLTDSNADRWGTRWSGIQILSFHELLDRRSEYHKVIIPSLYFREMEQALMACGMHRGTDFVTIRSFPND